MPVTPHAFSVGTTIADTYTIERVVGRGGMGVVLLATHNRLPGKLVALKVLHAELEDDEVRARFKREAQIASMLAHPNIVHIEDFNVTPSGFPYLVLEYLQGESLAQRLAKGPLSLEQMFAVVRQVGSALTAAHAKGIVHRDLKPQNIFLVATEIDGAPAEVAKVLDFGISKMIDSHSVKTEDNALLGTPQYMAPEQANGMVDAIDARTDVFAFGAIVHEMLTGAPAFAGSSIPQIVYKVVYEQPAPLPAHIPPAIVAAISRAMAKQPGDRFPTVMGFVEAVTGKRVSVPAVEQPNTTDPFARTVDSTRSTVAAAPTDPTRAAATAGTAPTTQVLPRSRRVVLAAIAAVVVAGGIGLAVALLGGGGGGGGGGSGSGSGGKAQALALDRAMMQSIATQLPTATDITVDGTSFKVGTTSKNLRKLAFDVGGKSYEAVEQNPERRTKWGKLAREGHYVVQFRDLGTMNWIGAVVDGVVDFTKLDSGD